MDRNTGTTDANAIVVAGIDVGKSKLNAHIPGRGLDHQFNNNQTGRRVLRNWLLKHGVTRAVFEPTRRYHRNLHQCLADAGLATVLVNPLRSRRFAEALGQFAKIDCVDAAMLARFGLLDDREANPAPAGQPPATQRLARCPPQALRRSRPRNRGLRQRHARGPHNRHR